jgi:hypothetical protein
MYYISRYWYPLVYRPTAYLYINAVVIVFILCSDPVYCMCSFVFCFSKLTQQLRCLVWYVSFFVVVLCICLCILLVVPIVLPLPPGWQPICSQIIIIIRRRRTSVSAIVLSFYKSSWCTPHVKGKGCKKLCQSSTTTRQCNSMGAFPALHARFWGTPVAGPSPQGKWGTNCPRGLQPVMSNYCRILRREGGWGSWSQPTAVWRTDWNWSYRSQWTVHLAVNSVLPYSSALHRIKTFKLNGRTHTNPIA